MSRKQQYDELVNRVSQVVVDLTADYTHTFAVNELKLDDEFGSRDSDEFHPLYGSYWALQTMMVMKVLGSVIAQLHFEVDEELIEEELIEEEN